MKILLILFTSVFIIFSSVHSAEKKPLIFTIEEMSDTCYLGKRLGVFNNKENESTGYNVYRIMDCDDSYFDFKLIDSSTSLLKSGMEAHLKSGSLYDSTFVIDIFSNSQGKYLVTTFFDKTKNSVVMLDYSPVSVLNYYENDTFEYTIEFDMLNLYNPCNSYIKRITFFDFSGKSLLSLDINNNSSFLQFNISDYPNLFIYYIETNKQNYLKKIFNIKI